MKILRFEAFGLLGKKEMIAGDLNSDLNILTGRNGAGKTSLMKLLWYVISGNILTALKDVPFQQFRVVTTEYDCTVHRLGSVTCKVEFSTNDQSFLFEDIHDEDGDIIYSAEDDANGFLMEVGSSVFLPTFRRIEGGFGLSSIRNPFNKNVRQRANGEIEEALVLFSKRLSNPPHIIVSSISTADIVSILLKEYADLSEQYNEIQSKTSQDIINKIKSFNANQALGLNEVNASIVLDDICSQVEGMEIIREKIMTPIETVRKYVARLFSHSGINIDQRLSFGDAANAVSSEDLSAGEKQMLSFICYNAFYKDSVIFIDEPELSLHVDWQRQLFPILQRQNSSNQFIIATHSPFIYSKYPDKEINLDVDRGEGEVSHE